MNETFGYRFEKLVLQAESMGIGTVWIGGTMDRNTFEKAMALGENEVMPCEMVRLAPSAVNKQPWRMAVRAEDNPSPM